MNKLIISEEQYKRLFLLEQGPPSFVNPGTGRVDQEARAKWEEEQRNLKNDPDYAKFREDQKKRKLKDVTEKRIEKNKKTKYTDNISKEIDYDEIHKIIEKIEKIKENYQSPHQKSAGFGCFFITGNGKAKGHGITIERFDKKGATDAKRKGKNKLSPYDTAAFVKENNIPAYVYTALAQFNTTASGGGDLPQVNRETIYEFFKEYYESDSPSEIISNIKKYGDIIMGKTWSPKLNERGKWKDAQGGINCVTRNNEQKIVFNWLPKGEGSLDVILEGLGDFIVYCAGDYHCWLDMASIAALAIPGAGIFIGGGIDAVNAMAYLVEARKLEGSNKKLHYLMAAGTMLGTISPLLKGYKVVSTGTKAGRAALTEFGEGYVKLTKGNLLSNKKAVKELYDDTIGKLTNEKDKIMIRNYYKEVSKAGPDVEIMIKKIGKFNREKGYDLQQFLNKNPANFDTFLKKADDDLFKALDAFRRTSAGVEALIQAGLFVALGTVLPPLVVKGYKEYQELVKSGTIQRASVGMMGGIQSQVEAAGFDWEDTKKYFGAILTDDPNYSNKKSEEDNDLLQKAWNTGWRPYKKKQGDYIIIPVDDRYQTDTYKDNLNTAKENIGRERIYAVKPKDEKDIEDGVTYFDTEEEMVYHKSILKRPIPTGEVPDDLF